MVLAVSWTVFVDHAALWDEDVWYAGSWVRVLVVLDFACWLFPRVPLRTEGVRPTCQLEPMAGSAACCTSYSSCCPFFPMQLQSTELPAESSRGGSPQGHKAGLLAARLTSHHNVLFQGKAQTRVSFIVSLNAARPSGERPPKGRGHSWLAQVVATAVGGSHPPGDLSVL